MCVSSIHLENEDKVVTNYEKEWNKVISIMNWILKLKEWY